MTNEARIKPSEPPYSGAAAAAFARVMPEGVPPLLLFRTLAVNERVLLRRDLCVADPGARFAAT